MDTQKQAEIIGSMLVLAGTYCLNTGDILLASKLLAISCLAWAVFAVIGKNYYLLILQGALVLINIIGIATHG